MQELINSPKGFVGKWKIKQYGKCRYGDKHVSVGLG
jgi:hypothetical protein